VKGSEARLRVLLGITNAIVGNLDQDSLLQAIGTELRRIIRFDRASLLLFDAERAVFKLCSLAVCPQMTPVVPVGHEFAAAGTRSERVLTTGRALVVRDILEAEADPTEQLFVREGLRSLLLAPVAVKDRALGVLAIGSHVPALYCDGDAELLTAVASQTALAVANMLAFDEIARLKTRLEQENLYLHEEMRTAHELESIVGGSRAIRKVLAEVSSVAPTDATVLVLGETGTGKELVARAVHALSPRRDAALVKVNCAALPPGLVESELFGHEKGAFTGALGRKVGRFELADGGTLLLDEIGDMPLDVQAKLMRVLQHRTFERVGGSQTLECDVRVVAATHVDLEEAIVRGTFREDLYYRLNVFPIRIPPLRERREDIPPLVSHLVMKHATRLGRKIETVSRGFMEAMRSYHWPGNVRELENVVERAVILSRGAELRLTEWPPRSVGARAPTAAETLQDVERRHILEVLARTGWRVSGDRGAAKVLGMKATTLEARMKRLGISRRATSPNIS
jgi:formate hydrogenlyase transcriptional activator